MSCDRAAPVADGDVEKDDGSFYVNDNDDDGSSQ